MFAVSPSSKSETRQEAGKAEGVVWTLGCIISPFLWEQLTETAQAAGEQSLVMLHTLCEGGEEAVTARLRWHQAFLDFPATSQVIFQPVVDLCCAVKGYWCVKW